MHNTFQIKGLGYSLSWHNLTFRLHAFDFNARLALIDLPHKKLKIFFFCYGETIFRMLKSSEVC